MQSEIPESARKALIDCVNDGSEDTPCFHFFEGNDNSPDACPHTGGDAFWKKVE